MPCYRRQDIDDLYQWVRDYVGVAQPRGRALEWSGRQQIRTVIVLKILGQSAWEPIGVRLWEYALPPSMLGEAGGSHRSCHQARRDWKFNLARR